MLELLKTRRIMYPPPQDLRPNPLNPPIRTSEKKMRAIISDLSRVKLIAPIIAVLEKEETTPLVIDGHRRRLGAIHLKIQKVPVELIEPGDTKLDLVDIYKTFNTQLAVSGSHRLYMMRKANVFYNPKEEELYHYLLNIGGTDIIDLMMERGSNVKDTYQWLLKITKHLHAIDSKEKMNEILYWLIDLKRIYDSRLGLEINISPSLWWQAIKEHKPLKGFIWNKEGVKKKR